MFNLPINLVQLGGQFWSWLTSYAKTTNGWINDQENIIKNIYTPTTVANLYPQSLMAIVAININEIEIAETIFDNLVKLYPPSTFNGMHNGYNSSTSTPDLTSDRYLSNNSFMLLALCHYASKMIGTSKQFKYKVLADTIVSWIVSFQDIPNNKYSYYNDSGLYCGFDQNNNIIDNYNKIQEAQVSAIAALRNHAIFYQGKYNSIANSVQAFLLSTTTGLRNGIRFYAGKWNTTKGTPAGLDTTNYLDNTTWAALMINDVNNFTSILNGVSTIDRDLVYNNIKPDCNLNITLSGYADVPGSNRIFPEAWAYVALIQYKKYLSTGNQTFLTTRIGLLSKYQSLVIQSKNFNGCSVPVVTNNEEYPGSTTSLCAEPVLWYLLAMYNINPFDPVQFNSQQFIDITNPFQLNN